MEGGPTPAQGTVGACFKNQWGAVCDTLWTDADAKVVCGQLGYTGKENGVVSTVISLLLSSDGKAILGSYYGAGSASFSWSDVGGCRGNESIITACAFTTPVLSCYSTNHAGVSCYSKLCLSIPQSAVGVIALAL